MVSIAPTVFFFIFFQIDLGFRLVSQGVEHLLEINGIRFEVPPSIDTIG